jgi:hypothetical protein
MPRLNDTMTGAEARKMAAEPRPFGAGLSPEIAANVERLELWYSTLDDLGDDWCEWKAYNELGLLFWQSGRVYEC